MKKGFLKLFLLIAVIFTGISVYAIDMDEYMISKSKKATPLDDNLQTTVTLSLPSVDESKCLDCVDIVFVMDKSTSTSNANINFSQQVKDLVAKLKERNLKVKVGIIKFRGTASDAIYDTTNGEHSKLVRYDENMDSYLETAINSTPSGNGSNIHAGLQLANKWLEEDTEVSNDKKNVVLLSDGKSYIWTDEDGNAITYYAPSISKFVASTGPRAGQAQIKDKYQWYNAYYKRIGDETGKLVLFTKDDLSGTGIDVDFNTLYNSTNEELKSINTKYDTKIDWNNWSWGQDLPGTLTTHTITNPMYSSQDKKYYKFTPDSSLDSSITWLEANPYIVSENEDGTVTYTDEINENYINFHPSSLEKGVYQAAHLYNKMNEKYIMSVIYPECLSCNPKTAAGAVSSLADQFNQWMASVSENSSPVEKDYTKIFDNIENDSVYLITKGKVTDVIGKDFDLVMNNNPFTLTVEDEELTSTKIGDNEWGFGEIDENGEYPYKVTYDPDKEEFYWDISVPVDVIKQVKLSYILELKNVPTEAGEYTFDTNEEAYLEYTSVYGEDNPKEYFEKPKVEYNVGKVTVKYITEEGESLADDVIKSDRVGKKYKTKEKSFDDYELIDIDGDSTGVYTKEDIIVTYIYQFVKGQGGDDVDIEDEPEEKDENITIIPPQTGDNGVSYFGIYIAYTIEALGAVTFIYKRND